LLGAPHSEMLVQSCTFDKSGTHTVNVLSSGMLVTIVSVIGVTVTMMIVVSHTPAALHVNTHIVSIPTKLLFGV